MATARFCSNALTAVARVAVPTISEEEKNRQLVPTDEKTKTKERLLRRGAGDIVMIRRQH